MNEFLIELLVEEIPARFQKYAISNFERLMIENLAKYRISYDSIKSYISPRRIVFAAKLDPIIPGFIEEKKGPQITAPAEVIEKFICSVGVSGGCCREKIIDKKTFIVVEIIHEEQKTSEILGKVVKDSIIGIRWQKSMHWGKYFFNFARPIRNIMCIFDGNLVDINLSSEMGLVSNNYTFGHRFMAPHKVYPYGIGDYLKKMLDAFVVVDHKKRREIILDSCANIKFVKNGLVANISEDLLEEVVGLVEYPVVLVGKIPEKFMKLPQEVIITPMKEHQRYFPTKIKDKLAPYFVFVANNIAEDGGKEIVAGNERVLNARLSDALFFFEIDMQIPLKNRLENLKKITFNDKLGTVYDRVNRIKNICSYMYDEIYKKANIQSLASEKSKDLLLRGATLAKCDLSTNMVCEFAELQGIMGAYYAEAQGENPEICCVIREQYKQPDALSSPLSAIFSLADKLELIIGLFSIGKEPTGSKDPFALRRAAIAIIKIILKYEFIIDLRKIVELSFELLKPIINEIKKDDINKVISFLIDRLRVFLKDKGVEHGVTISVTSCESDILSAYKKALILDDALKSDSGKQLMMMYKRARNIVGNDISIDVNVSLFSEKKERELFDSIVNLEKKLDNIEQNSDCSIEKFKKMLINCVSIENVVSSFFDDILVNVDDEKIRRNRINIIGKLLFIFNKNLPELELL